MKISFKILNWIVKSILVNRDYSSHVNYWQGLVLKWMRTRGNRETMKMIKAIRLHVTRYLCGHPLKEPAHPCLGINSFGLPKRLGILQELVFSNDVSDRRLLLTLLSISRVFDIRGTPSLEDITTPSPSPVTESLIQEFLSVLADLDWKITRPEWKRYHLSLKAGPNAQAMLGSIIDLHCLSQDQINDLMTLAGSEKFNERIEMLKSIPLNIWIDKFDLQNKGSVRRLSVVHAPEAKERVIAIFDYWSQTCLKPLHDALMKHLKGIKQDLTFNQTSALGRLPNTGPYYSLDLHAATDRFPVSLQHRVLGELIGSHEYADAWLRTMTGHEFMNPFGNPVKYATGQPMGAYSSWAVFALTHHLTVRVSAKRAGEDPVSFNKYILLGDDIVIADKAVALEYKKLIQELGVTISDAKSHVSNDTFEFAKRWYQAGTEITGIQLSAFQSVKNWSQATEELISSLSRWSITPEDLDNRVLTSFLGALGQRARDFKKARVYLCLPREVDTEERTYTKYQYLASVWFNRVLSCNHSKDVVRQLITDSLSEAKIEILHSGVSNLEKVYSEYTIDLSEFEGLVDKAVLDSTPLLETLRLEKYNLSNLREFVDELHWNLDERLSFSRFALSAIDPKRSTAKRGREIIISNLASVGHYCSQFAAEYCYTRNQLFTDNPVPKTISRFR